MMRTKYDLAAKLVTGLLLLLTSACTPIMPPAQPHQAVAAPPAQDDCPLTAGQRLAAPPITSDGLSSSLTLADKDEPGERLRLTGRVLLEDCRPLAGAVIEFEHANLQGEYTDLKGRIATDAEGRFALETIKPGMYGAPAHIHVVITHPDANALGMEIVFAGDPLISAEMQNIVVVALQPEKTQAGSGFWGEVDLVIAQK